MIADLHIHTTASDGRLSPEEILEQAANAGLAYIAITDHDTVDGLLRLQNLCPANSENPVILSGIEFSADFPDNEVHILGYGFNPIHPELQQQLEILTQDRLTRAERMTKKLAMLGYPVDFSRLLEIAGGATSVGRPHVAAALLEKGYFPTVGAVFENLLEKSKPGYLPHYKIPAQDIIELIKTAGGIPVLAHPGLVGDEQLVREIIRMGVLGIEVYHPKHDPSQIKHYHALATERQLLITGGSDFHAIPGRYPERLGEFTVPGELALNLTDMLHA